MNHKKGRHLGLVGVGYWGKNLARNFDQLGALHTLCDMHEANLQKFQSAYPVPDVAVTTRFQTLLDHPDIQQIAIAAPALQHYTLAKEALLAGKDVYVEKPLCMQSYEAEELIKLAEKKGRILMVGHLLQYHASFRKMVDLVQKGELGPLHYISSHRLNLGSYRVEENALWNFAPHDISMILALMENQLPDQVRSVGGVYLSPGVADTVMTTLRFPKNIRAHVYVSWLNPFKEQKLTVVGSKGMLVFDDTKPWGEKLHLYRDHISWAHGPTPVAQPSDPIKVDPPAHEPLKEECQHFLWCCETRTRPLTDGHEGLRVMRVLDAAQKSLELEGETQVPVPAFPTMLIK